MTTVAIGALQVDRLSMLLALMALAAVGALAVRRWPKVGVLSWLLVIAFVPDWLGYNVVGYWPPAVLAAGFLVVMFLPTRRLRLGLADGIALAFFAACLTPYIASSLRFTAIFAVVAIWILPWLLGRLMPLRVDAEWIYTAIAIVMAVVAAGAIVEFLIAANPFVLVGSGNRSFETWGEIQVRGGFARAEGAFGHSIALGASLALAIPFAVVSRLPTLWRALAIGMTMSAIALTFSRGSLLAGAAALLFSVLFLRSGLTGRVKVLILMAGLACMAIAFPLLSEVFTDAGAEAERSGAYRFELAGLVDAMRVIGTSDLARVTSSGQLVFGEYESIDSALVLLGLNYGLFALGVAIVAYLSAVWSMLKSKGGPAVVALVAQAPTLMTVALITQYAAMFWFVAGLAVYSLSSLDVRSATSRARSTSRGSSEPSIPQLEFNSGPPAKSDALASAAVGGNSIHEGANT